MNLVADASALVGELLRARGRALLRHPDIDWFATMEVASEVQHEVRKRLRLMVARGRLADEELAAVEQESLDHFTDSVTLVVPEVYAPARLAAQERMHDPQDWSAVALALVMEVGIWTEDRDFFGIGLPVWNTRVLMTYLRIN
jgi:predicted nucleic acid-binding protein